MIFLPRCNVLAHLSAEAPSSEIRDCIRLYNQQRDYSTNKTLSAVPVGILVEIMTYLGACGQDVYVKPTILHNLICRIQNLFPEHVQSVWNHTVLGRTNSDFCPAQYVDKPAIHPVLLVSLKYQRLKRTHLDPGRQSAR